MLFQKFKNLFILLLFTFSIPNSVLSDNLKLRSFGHSSFLVKGGGVSILLNPFKSVGCTEGLEEKNDLNYDFILASSRLADEGYNPNDNLMFVDSGTYKVKDMILNGINISHDKFGGRRFGMATVWIWEQSNFKIVHMSGAAGEVNFNNQILLARPDLLFISIGGGNKGYDGKDASKLVKKLKPKAVIPVHFSKDDNLNEKCAFSDESEFLENISNYQIKYVGKNFSINKKSIQKNTIFIVE